MSAPPAIAVVIVCHDSEAELRRTLPALAGQLRDGDEVLVVDSGSSDGTAAVARALLPQATVIEPGGNVGFAVGCNLAVEQATAPLVLLLNPDAVPEEGCLDELRRASLRHPDWAAWQALVLMDGATRVNSAGNPVHWLGFAWAGGLGKELGEVGEDDRTVPTASGAAFCVRRELWVEHGGFDPRYFMYGEDLDLSLRLRLAGWQLGLVPSARVDHDYTFTKGAYKWFYLERNRWWTVLSTYPRPLLAAVLPALLAFEVALLVAAAAGGWLPAKLRSQRAVLGSLRAVAARRREVQRRRTVSAGAFAAAFTAELDSPALAAAQRLPWLTRAQAGVWRRIAGALR